MTFLISDDYDDRVYTASYGALLPDGKARIVDGFRKEGRKEAFADVGVALLAVANSMRILWRRYR